MKKTAGLFVLAMVTGCASSDLKGQCEAVGGAYNKGYMISQVHLLGVSPTKYNGIPTCTYVKSSTNVIQGKWE